jgi:hypothetical protein
MLVSRHLSDLKMHVETISDLNVPVFMVYGASLGMESAAQ